MRNKLKKAFGTNLKLIRKSRNITQEKLAEVIGINLRQLARIEAGESFVTSETIERICKSLDLTIRELFDFDFNQEIVLLKNGTDNICYFKGTQVGSVVKLEQNKTDVPIKRNLPFEDRNEVAIDIAKQINKPITVEYFKDNKVSEVLVYYPDGTIKSQINEEDKKYQENINYILDKCKKIAKSNKKIEFVKLAIDALEKPESLEKMKIMIECLELLREK